jgi:DnaJ-domain-containing protein 1
MIRWYGKLLGLVAGAALFRPNPLLGALLGLLIGHAFDADWFRLRRRDDPYRVLGLTEDADDAEVDRAWRRLIAQYHPDRLAGAADELRRQAEARAREINRAYDRIQTLRKRNPPRV